MLHIFDLITFELISVDLELRFTERALATPRDTHTARQDPALAHQDSENKFDWFGNTINTIKKQERLRQSDTQVIPRPHPKGCSVPEILITVSF